MTKKLLTAPICALSLLLPACGGGGAGGGEGGTPPSPSGDAAEVAECLGQERVRARADKAGATLVRAPSAQDAVVAEFRSNTANVFFFASKEAAADVKEQVRDEDLANIEEEILIVFENAPRGDQEEQIDDCLPEDPEDEQQKDEKQQK